MQKGKTKELESLDLVKVALKEVVPVPLRASSTKEALLL
jgi:hypothetical protein